MAELWTKERVLSLAPDASSAAAGRGQAAPGKWPSLGRAGEVLWGECQGSGKTPYQVRVDLREPAYKCSCPSRKFPCKHSLGLMLLFAEHPKSLPETALADWVNEWLESREKRAEQREKKATTEAAKPVDAAAQAKRSAQREAKIQAGVEDLGRLLSDVLRQGLAAAQTQRTQYWQDVAARLVDAQAPGLARLVGELGQTVGSGDQWRSRFLRRLARIHLAAQGYARLADLPSETQADLRTVIGWTQSREELLAVDAASGQWLIVASAVSTEDRVTAQRTWLLREQDGLPALVLSFAAGGQPLDTSLMVGTAIDAELVFYPSATPLRAIVKQRSGSPLLFQEFTGSPTIDAALDAFSLALANNPWIERWPMALANVAPIAPSKLGVGWRLCDSSGGQLPLDPQFTEAWTLLSISGGQPITVFGEWDGEQLTPMSVSARGVFYSCSRRSDRTLLARVS